MKYEILLLHAGELEAMRTIAFFYEGTVTVASLYN